MKTDKLFRRIALGCLLTITTISYIPAQSLAVDSLRHWLSYIAADEMNGRINGSKEIEELAFWLSDKYQQYGVIPLEGNKNLFQEYTVGGQETIHKNVIGYIPSKNKEENNHSYIVLSAHFDHIGKINNTICNGADDDASGIVALLGIAKNICENDIKPACPIILAAFSGEEIGLQGSKAFCTSNIITPKQIKLNINFELVGRSDEYGKNRFYITGQKYSTLADIIQKYNRSRVWQLTDIGETGNLLYRMADSYSFIQHANNSAHCVPAHTIATNIGMSYIHSDKDTIENIDFENLYSFINYMTEFIYYISKQEIKIECLN